MMRAAARTMCCPRFVPGARIDWSCPTSRLSHRLLWDPTGFYYWRFVRMLARDRRRHEAVQVSIAWLRPCFVQVGHFSCARIWFHEPQRGPGRFIRQVKKRPGRCVAEEAVGRYGWMKSGMDVADPGRAKVHGTKSTSGLKRLHFHVTLDERVEKLATSHTKTRRLFQRSTCYR